VTCASGRFYRHLEGIDRNTWKRDSQTAWEIKTMATKIKNDEGFVDNLRVLVRIL
jgi:hypothetical protein